MHNNEDLINRIIVGDSLSEMKSLPDACVDLIVTSPPYSDQRKGNYPGPSADTYVAWFLPFAEEFRRVLNPTGSFVLNIKEKVVSGERHTYVVDLILAMRGQGWLWTEEYIWQKLNCHPGKWPNRFRDAWERCLHFTKNKKFYMNQEAVMVPTGDWAKSRLKNLSQADCRRENSMVNSGFGKKVSNWVGRSKAYPTNVLRLATECGNKTHSAAFPVGLPEWFIKLFSKEGDTVLDPFAGSGSTAVAARRLNRNWIMIEIVPESCLVIHERLRKEFSEENIGNGNKRPTKHDTDEKNSS